MSKPRLDPIQEKEKAAAIELLVQAFEANPLLAYLLPPGQPRGFRHEKMAAFFEFACMVRFELDWPLLGCWEDHE
jgi:hypothetical protein